MRSWAGPRRRAGTAAAVVGLVLVGAGCSSNHYTPTSATDATVEVTSGSAGSPASTAASSGSPGSSVSPVTTTAPASTVPRSAGATPTASTAAPTTADPYPGLDNYQPTPRPALRVTSSTGSCTTVAGGYGVAASVLWSDGVVETLDSAGPFTTSTHHASTGSRGSTADITIDGSNCQVKVTTSDP